MGEVQQKLKALEARQQQLLAAEARAAANMERAQKDYEEARAHLKSMGFETVADAQQWLDQASKEVSAKIAEVEQIMTEAGV